METMPGFFSGNTAKSAPGIIEVGVPDITGDRTIRMIAESSPPYIDHTAPRVVKRRQNRE